MQIKSVGVGKEMPECKIWLQQVRRGFGNEILSDSSLQEVSMPSSPCPDLNAFFREYPFQDTLDPIETVKQRGDSGKFQMRKAGQIGWRR